MTTNPVTHIPVLVIGAGPTGLATAALLRRHGVEVRLVDRAIGTSVQSKANLLWCRTLEVLDELGLATAAQEAGDPLVEGRYSAGAKRLATVRTNAVPGTRFQPTIVQQNTTERILAGALDVPVEWGTEALEFAVDGERPEVLLRRPDGGTERVRAEYLVACDGMRSRVRAAAGVEFEGEAIDEDFVLGDAEVSTDLERNTAYQFFGTDGFLIASQLPGGLWRLAGPVGKPVESPGPADLQHLVDKYAPGTITVTGAAWVDSFRISQRVSPGFQRGRVLLAGDAVHVHSPAAGQGLNSSIQDAHNLAWKLAFVVRGLAGPRLLETYGHERKEVAEAIRRVTRMQAKMWFMARTPLARLRRTAMLRLLDRTGAFERKLLPRLAQLTIDYASSPLTGGAAPRKDPLRPGLRLPDVEVTLADGDRAWTLALCADTRLTLLTAAPGALDALAARYSAAVVLRPVVAGGPLAPLATDVVAVRPDGHVGYRGPATDVAALERWLTGPLALTASIPTSIPAGAHDATDH
ncbi:MAG: NAD(P)-binding protein [Actinophytocola sp.]|uniref:FAD-dependent monooxygenase n=1 Tax=Actinophytocola sp. TaxID=1872138 RepID=UPI00132A013E|nr:FAD-dependent monooxygenase [Actinophytocola sp.]MPZ85460.1 NAD(P)-binding protein [Actinophytocola sp.]